MFLQVWVFAVYKRVPRSRRPPFKMAITLGAIISVRYAPTAAIALLFFDHLLTLDQEVDAIWSRRCSRYTTRGLYVLHRYFTEGVLLYTVYMFGGYTKRISDAVCRRVLWLFVLSATLFVGVLQFVTTIRLYRSWDSQIRIRYILIGAFSVCYVAAAILSIISVTLLIRAEHIIHPTPILGDQCATGNLPKTVPWVLGILLAFDVFVIALSLYRALEMPRRSQTELLYSLHLDGARIHLAVSALWLLLLLSSVFAQPYIFFALLCLFWSLNACVGCRLQLRLEGLQNGSLHGDSISLSSL
ncbi:hypothetical protein CPB85DRAFT_1403332, partial [Mucidula mucida]